MHKNTKEKRVRPATLYLYMTPAQHKRYVQAPATDDFLSAKRTGIMKPSCVSAHLTTRTSHLLRNGTIS